MNDKLRDDFLTMVRDGAGYVAFQGKDGWFRQQYCSGKDEMLALIDKVSHECDVWVSMGTFPDPNGGRKATKASQICSFWFDIDAHEGSKYESPEAAKSAFDEFLGATGLPQPNIIHWTGYGVQALWALDAALIPEEWLPLAQKLQGLAETLELEIDPITKDMARVLRMAGTKNFRNPEGPVPTRVDNIGVHVNLTDFIACLDKAVEMYPPAKSQTSITLHAKTFDWEPTEENIQRVKKMLEHVDPDPNPKGGGNRARWMRIVWSVASTGWDEDAYKLALDWSKSGDLFNQRDFDGVWDSYSPNWTNEENSGVGFGTLRKFAREGGYTETVPVHENTGAQGTEKLYTYRLITKAASDITPEPVEWLVNGSIPLGAMVVIGGQPGLGKSQIGIKLAAAVTTGGGLPDNSTFANLGSVIILANEDDAARTIRPRLDAAGADTTKVHIVEGLIRENGGAPDLFQLETDIKELRETALRIGDVRLIIIDPPSAYLGSKVDSHKDSDVRKVLTPLDLPPINSTSRNLVKSVFGGSNGHEEEIFRGADYWLPEGSGGWGQHQGLMPSAWVQ